MRKVNNMYGNSLQQAISIINDYLENGNTLYLFNETNSGEHIRLNQGEKLGFVLSSGNFKITENRKPFEEGNAVKRLKEKIVNENKDNFDWRDSYR